MTEGFSSYRPLANCSASGESCDAVVVENFRTTIADLNTVLHALVQYMYMTLCTRTCARAGTIVLTSACLAVLHTAWQCGPNHYA